jgi:antitoxin component YwqK of YwqJK toxin-antitoxin module
MKKLITLIILCLCLPGAVGAEKCEYRAGEIYFVKGKWVEISTGRPASGSECMYRDNGRLWSERPYKNGAIDGIMRIYHKNGNIEWEFPYKNGKKDGIAKVYYESGKLNSTYPYKNGKMEGISMFYYKNGRLFSETIYKNDKKEGHSQRYYENGRLLGKILYRNSKPVSGSCANGRPLTNAELINWENGYAVSCN